MRAELTNNGEVEGSLTEAIVVPQFNGVAAAVLLLATGNGQLTAAVAALDGDVGQTLLDLQDHAPQPSSLFSCVCVCVFLYLTGFLNLSQVQLMGGAPLNLQKISTFSPARIFMSSGNCSI